MSGGFFRGTSADQDTRFSNKQAKLLKTQKFHAELEHLVDMTKVKIDVMKPWIAARVTELLGFEDEVLINFVYGLLEGKEVNGKQVQISLTGFMEKNTGKFMKELWTLLLSAQTNASGVPQQFLDAKEEETRKKKEEIERAADEIRKKREKESTELEQEKSKNMDEGDQSKAAKGDRELSSGRFMSRISNDNLDYRRDNSKRDGMRGSRRGSRSRSISRSCSNSRSYSNSRSISKSPERRRRSLTPRRRYSPRESQSPSKQRSSYYRRRSRSPYRRSPSPRRRRNYSRRSHSPVQRRSVTPVRRRSPLRRRRSPSLVRRSSPLRQRSPPMSRRSFHAVRRMSSSPKSPSSRSTSPVQGKSHLHRRSPSPVRRRSPSPVRRQSPSPTRRRPRSPVHQRLCSPVRRHQRRSRSIPKHESPPATRRSTMPGRKRSVSPLPKASDKQSSPSPIRQSSLSPAKCSVAISKIPPQSRDRKRRSSSPDVSPVRQVKNQVMHDSLNSSRRFGKHKQHPESPDTSKERSGERKTLKSTFESHISPSRIRGHADASEMRSKEKEGLRDKFSGKRDHSVISEKQMSPPLSKFSLQEKERKSQKSYSLGMKQSAKSDAAGDSIKLQKLDLVSKSVGKVDNEEGGTSDSVSEESDKGFRRKEKKRRKRSGRHEIDSESQSDDDSEAEDRKEVKKRKKEEKKLRKEGRRRRREERRRRKEEKRAEKSKTRRIDSDSSPASDEKRHSNAGRGEAEKDEKTLEIELRMKALETLKAKRSVNT